MRTLEQLQAVLHFTNDFPSRAVLDSAGALPEFCARNCNWAPTRWPARPTPWPDPAAYPMNALSESGALLLGEGYTDLRDDERAGVFKIFLDARAAFGLGANVKRAMARAYEEEQHWPDALAQYAGWLRMSSPPTICCRRRCMRRRWATFQAGDETKPSCSSPEFCRPCSSNARAGPMADNGGWRSIISRLGDSKDAEVNYKTIFQNTNWLDSAPV